MSIWITGAALLGSAAIGAYSTNQASKAAQKGSKRAQNTQMAMFNQIRQDQAPYREVGTQALNAYAQALGLPGYSGNASGGHPLYGDGNQPLTAEGVIQAFRDVLGRDISGDPNGAAAIRHYTTRGPKEGSYKGASGIKGQLHDITGAPDVLGLGSSDNRKRRAFTFNEFLDATLAGDEYQDKVSRGVLDPWTDERRQAIFNPQRDNVIAGGKYGGFQESPGYQFRMDEGQKGINRALASRGLLNSGARGKALTRFNQDYASNEFNNYLNQLANAAGIGQVATNQTSAYGAQTAGNVANAQQRAADSRASGYLGIGNTLNSGINNYLMLRALQ